MQSHLKTMLCKIQVREYLIICCMQLGTIKLLKLENRMKPEADEASEKKSVRSQ
jgi:hypothetical protein